ncbi:hypothetical protein B2J93_9132 [Marssonina coronariae]|uniref:Uncharacterized protein n=1 Tax=Diplocarpon coronariae TaxID=2795749 RepID=A0A218YU16_9HELO|nr:hypothetical protein B2J93_9132 [Marssonina coronariae]
MDRFQATGKIKKRKAETQDNERLSKRLSLLNLGKSRFKLLLVKDRAYGGFTERNGERLYVPVEHTTTSTAPLKPKSPLPSQDDDNMQLDNTKHKVYIYDLDAELSDSSESDDGKLVFLPDIQKHLRETRIPPMVFANREGELAGMNNQLVLYNIPSSLSVPEEKDSVRKAVIEARARARALQEQKLNGEAQYLRADANGSLMEGKSSFGSPQEIYEPRLEAMEDEPTQPMVRGLLDDDPDAMDLG